MSKPDTKKTGKPGRPAYDLDAEGIEKLTSYGLSIREIGDYFGVSQDTIERNYAESIKKGRGKLAVGVKRRQIEVADEGNPTMLIWVGKQYLGQKDAPEVESKSKGLIAKVLEKLDAKPEH